MPEQRHDHALIQYLAAGARLTGATVSKNVNGGYNVTVAEDGTCQQYAEHTAGGLMRMRVYYATLHFETMDFGLKDLLEAHQPDRESSRSCQHYIDTGRYLTVRETALG